MPLERWIFFPPAIATAVRFAALTLVITLLNHYDLQSNLLDSPQKGSRFFKKRCTHPRVRVLHKSLQKWTKSKNAQFSIRITRFNICIVITDLIAFFFLWCVNFAVQLFSHSQSVALVWLVILGLTLISWKNHCLSTVQLKFVVYLWTLRPTMLLYDYFNV